MFLKKWIAHKKLHFRREIPYTVYKVVILLLPIFLSKVLENLKTQRIFPHSL